MYVNLFERVLHALHKNNELSPTVAASLNMVEMNFKVPLVGYTELKGQRFDSSHDNQ